MGRLEENANQLLREQKYDEAAVIYEQLLQKDPDNIILLANASTCQIKTGHFSKAIDFLDRALQLAPANPQLYSDRGVAYFLNGKINESLRDMDQAQSLDPANPYRYSSRAFIRDKAGNIEGAVQDYEKAIDLDPQDAVSLNNLGLILEKQGYQEKAKSNFAKADAMEGRPPLPEINKEKEKRPLPKTSQFKTINGGKPKLNLAYFSQTVASVITTKKGFREFLKFLAGKRNP